MLVTKGRANGGTPLFDLCGILGARTNIDRKGKLRNLPKSPNSVRLPRDTPPDAPGEYAITASYSGDENYDPSYDTINLSVTGGGTGMIDSTTSGGADPYPAYP
jgi:hypothetical protein